MGKTDPPNDVGRKESAGHRKDSQRSGQDATRQGSMQPNQSRQQAASSSSSSRPKPPSKIAGGKFEIGKKLGAGCFGEVYEGTSTENKQEVAIKFEALEARTQQLEQEATIMSLLRNPSQPQGFSECFWFGREGRYQCMVMERLGKSLEDTVQQCENTRFKALTSALVAEQLVRRCEYLHSKGIVHRDIKPENFMWGRGSKIHHVCMIDFGLSKRYFDKTHVAPREKLSLTGTARYASINAHKGLEQSRRDDLEAIGHMLLYFLRGALPWSGLDAKTKEEKYRKIRQKKEETDLKDLCQGHPEEFCKYLQYCRNLEFTERPDYKMLRSLFDKVREKVAPNAEDHHVEWLVEANLDKPTLVPLNPYTPPKQPDDQADDTAGKRWCLCGGSKQPRDS